MVAYFIAKFTFQTQLDKMTQGQYPECREEKMTRAEVRRGCLVLAFLYRMAQATKLVLV